MKKLIAVIVISLLGLAAVEYYINNPKALQSIKNPFKASKKLPPLVRLVRDNNTFCSGTVINDHIILTAAHCLIENTIFGPMMNPSDIEIRNADNINIGVFAKPFKGSPQMDSAVLIGDFTRFDSKKYLSNVEDLIKVGQENTKLIACGFPLGGPAHCSETLYKSRLNFFWTVNGVLLPGMSGGPVMLEDGTVVAINSAVFEDISIVSPTYNIEVMFK